MRTYEEMKRNVFKRIEEYKIKKKKKIYMVSSVSLLLVFFLSSIFLIKLICFEPNNSTNITGVYNSPNSVLAINNKSYVLSNKDYHLFTLKNFIGFSDDFTTIDYEIIENESKIFTVTENENYIIVVSKDGKKTLLCQTGYRE